MLNFTKMTALGNDFIIINAINNPELINFVQPYITQLSDRHFGIGSDGVIFIESSLHADFKMRIFNSDGSEAEFCGNGTRQVCKYLYDFQIHTEKMLTLETLKAIHTIELSIKNNEMLSASVCIGVLDFKPKHAGFLGTIQKNNIPSFEYNNLTFFTGSIGNPHAVCFLEQDITIQEIKDIGMSIEKNTSLFLNGANIEFININSPEQIRLRVWERGAGYTLACGSGAAFATGVGMELGLLNPHKVTVQLDGGSLVIERDDQKNIYLIGDAQIIFQGTIEISPN